MDTLAFAVIAAVVLAFALVSRPLQRTSLTAPMLFTAAGLVLGPAALGIAELDFGHGFIHGLAEITLILVLFSDAARIELAGLGRDHDLPLRLLMFGMPLTIALGAILALALPLGLTLWEAALLAAILAPTDAALGQSVVSSPAVPVRIRQALNVESGLNDGIALPLVLIFATCAGAGQVSRDVDAWLLFGALQVILGPLAGIAVGWLGASLLDRAVQRQWMAMAFQGPAILATVLLAFVAAGLVDGNGFIAAFTAGLVFGHRVRGHCRFIFEFAESEGQLLVLLTFLIFGAAVLPEAIGHLDWAVLAYAVGSLTVVRMLPVALALLGSGLRPLSVAFMGWFGPRGLASILFALFVLEGLDTPGSHTILVVTIVTAALSILAHGLTAAPLARRYGAAVRRSGECAETMPVSEMPTRTGMVEPDAAR